MGKSEKRKQFKLNLPKGWQDQTVYFFRGPEDFGLQHSLSVMIDDDPVSGKLDEYVETHLDHTLSALPDAEVLHDESRERPDGSSVRTVTLSWRPPGKKAELKRLYFVLKDGVFYQFSGPFTKQTLKTIATQVDRMIDELEFA